MRDVERDGYILKAATKLTKLVEFHRSVMKAKLEFVIDSDRRGEIDSMLDRIKSEIGETYLNTLPETYR